MKKKVGLVTCYFKHNYGSMLQAYATQKILDDNNIPNETINIEENIDFKKGKRNYYLSQIFNFTFIKSKFGMIKLRLDKKRNKKLGKNIKFNSNISDIEYISKYNELDNLLRKINVINQIRDNNRFNLNSSLMMDKLIIDIIGG